MPREVRSHQDVPPPVSVTEQEDGAPISNPVLTDETVPEPIAVEEKFVRFLRNAGPVTKTIVLKDGTQIDFPTYTHKAFAPDDELVAKIREVAKDYQLHEESN